MGILGKLVGTGAEVLENTIEKVFVKREEKNLKLLSEFPYTYKHLIREVKHTTANMDYAKEVRIKGDFFTVFNIFDSPIYFARNIHSLTSQTYELMDMHYSKIATIECKKSHFNSKKYTCNINTTNYHLRLGTNIIFGKRRFKISDSSFKMETNDFEKIFKIYQSDRTIIQINKVSSDLGAKWGEFIVGCNSEKHKLLSILITISIGIMFMKSENLLAGD